MTDYASQLLSGSDRAQAGAEARVHDYANDLLGSDSAEMLGDAVTVTPAGGVTSIQGRAGLSPRVAGAATAGYTIEDFKDKIANYEADDSTTASFGTLAKAAAVDDPQTKLEIFARARFPKDKSAVNRYGFTSDGEVLYVGTDGKLYRDTPAGAMGWLKEAGAGLVGKAAPIAGGAIGGSVAAPGFGTVAGAAIGAAGGEGVRKIVGGLVFDEPASPEGVLKSMAMEGAFSGGGALLGAGLVRWLNRHAARDLSKLDKAAATDLSRKADDLGVELNPAQATNLPSIKGKFEALARMPTSSDAIEEGMKRQAEQANRAAYRFLQQVSAREGIEEVGEQGVNAAGKVIAMVAKERADAARPLYQKAFQTAANLAPENNPALAALIERPAMRAALKRAVVLAKNEGIDLADPANKLLGLHFAKLALDDAIENAGRNASGTTFKRGLTEIKTQLLKEMDTISPDYAIARKTFAHFSPSVEAIKGGVVSRIADLPPEKVSEAARLLFKPGSSPRAVEQARNLFTKAGLRDDYNALLRSYLQESLEQSGRQFKTTGGMVGQAPAWRAAMLGDPSQARVLRAAMDANQWQGFNNMMDVFEAMGRVTGRGNSITMPMQEAAAAIRQESGAGAMGQLAGLASPQEIGKRFMQWRAEVRLGNHAEKLAQIMTDPKGMAQLKELVKLDPASEQFILRAAGTFGISVAPSVNPRDRQ